MCGGEPRIVKAGDFHLSFAIHDDTDDTVEHNFLHSMAIICTGWRRFKLMEYGPNQSFSEDKGTFDICSVRVVPYKTMAPIRRLLGKISVFRRG